MGKQNVNKAAEPSMEDIIASIRRIVTAEPSSAVPPAVPTATPASAAAATTKPADVVTAAQKRLEIEDFDAVLDLVDSAPARKKIATGSERKPLNAAIVSAAIVSAAIVSADVDDLLEPMPRAVGRQSSDHSKADAAAVAADNARLAAATSMSAYGKSAVVPNALIPMGGAFQGMPRTAASRPTWQYARSDAAPPVATVAGTGAAPIPDLIDELIEPPAPTAESVVAAAAMAAELTTATADSTPLQTFVGRPPNVCKDSLISQSFIAEPGRPLQRTLLSALTAESLADDIAVSAALGSLPLPVRENRRSGLDALTSALASLPFASTLPLPTVNFDVHGDRIAEPAGGTVDAEPLSALLLPIKVRDFAATADTVTDAIAHAVTDAVAGNQASVTPPIIELAVASAEADPVTNEPVVETVDTSAAKLEREHSSEQSSDLNSPVIVAAENVTSNIQPDEPVSEPVELTAVAHVTEPVADLPEPQPQIALASNQPVTPTLTPELPMTVAPVPQPSFAALRTLARTTLPAETAAPPVPSSAPSWALARGAARSTPGTSAPILAGDSSEAAALAAMEALFPSVRKPSVAPKSERAKVMVAAVADAEPAAPIGPVSVATTLVPLTLELTTLELTDTETTPAAASTLAVAADETAVNAIPVDETPPTATATGVQPVVDVAMTMTDAASAVAVIADLPVEVPSPAVAAKTLPTEPSATLPASIPTVPTPPVGPVPARSLEDAVVDLLRPMLRNWIDANMPVMVEKALRAETSAMAPPVLPISVPASAPTQKPN